MIKLRLKSSQGAEFNMTGVIDVVFLLIIFFMLVCQFIVAENFEVAVPDQIDKAQSFDSRSEQMTTVTVFYNEDGLVEYAVGAEKVGVKSGFDISEMISEKIDIQLNNLKPEERAVCLRIDKDICYEDSQYALAGISLSSAREIKLSGVRDKVHAEP